MKHFSLFVARHFCRLLKVDFHISGNDTDEKFRTVARQHECLKHLIDVFVELVGDMLCTEVRLIHNIRHERVRYFCLIQQTRHVCFTYCCHNATKVAQIVEKSKFHNKVVQMKRDERDCGNTPLTLLVSLNLFYF